MTHGLSTIVVYELLINSTIVKKAVSVDINCFFRNLNSFTRHDS